MLAALVIVFRESVEAGLIVGIVLAATVGIPRRGAWVAAGIAAGVLGACVVAMFAGSLSAAFAGIGQELFNAAILGTAAIMLIWHNTWMAAHAREIANEMRTVGTAVAAGKEPLSALAIVVGIAVLREGFEVVLFLYGIIASDGASKFATFLGGLGGLALGAVLTTLTYLGLVRIPTRYLFTVTGVMIAFLAAGLAAQAVGFLEQANVLTVLGETAWDSSGLLPDSSLLGRVLHTFIGYTDRPSQMQFIVYVGMLAVMYALAKLFASTSRPAESRT